MRLGAVATVAVFVAASAGCTSMLLGGSGASAGRPIGTESRNQGAIDRDREISARIRSYFRADAELGAARLMVETWQGRVTLSGQVPAFDLRDRAVRIASDVEGVASVSNQISVRP